MTILNQRDARVARARLGQIGRALSGEASEGAQLASDILKMRRAALIAEHERLSAELGTYSQLLNGEEADITSAGLGLIPILARSARGLSQRELAELLGMREQQIQRYESERYSGISLARYERILEVLSVELQPKLAQKSVVSIADAAETDAVSPQLLKEIKKREWVDLPRGISTAETHDRLNAFAEVAYSLGGGRSYHRRTLSGEINSQALTLWKSRVLQVADTVRSRIRGRFNLSDTSWIGQLVRLSVVPDGPARAVDRLREFGIITIIEPHLPQTRLDGAAMLLRDSIPVIGLTLRHDRVDNFWFTLLHELGHIYLHFNHGLKDGFIDDVEEAGSSEIEQQADSFAQSHLISPEAWKAAPVRFSRSKDMVVSFARSQNIHPAIVAGRIRRERDYTLFTDMLGRGQVKPHLLG